MFLNVAKIVCKEYIRYSSNQSHIKEFYCCLYGLGQRNSNQSVKSKAQYLTQVYKLQFPATWAKTKIQHLTIISIVKLLDTEK